MDWLLKLCLWLTLWPGVVGLSLTLLFLRQPLKALGCLKELLACLVDRELLNHGPDLLRLPAILRRLVMMGCCCMAYGLQPNP
jgi:hypothetical protein